jgi:hypothetical protein
MWSTFASEGGEDSCPSTNALVTDEPGSTTGLPLHYVLVAGLGLVFGIAVAPWAENWYRRSADRS